MSCLNDSIDVFSETLKRLCAGNVSVQFESFVLEKWPSNHLVSGIIDGQKDCIVASAFFETESSNSNESFAETNPVFSVNQSNVIGSPLKLHDFLKDVNFTVFSSQTPGQQISLKPVSVTQARYLLSLYNLSHQNCTKQQRVSNGGVADTSTAAWLPLWVLCDGQDGGHTAWMSSAVEKFDKRCCRKSTLTQGSDSNMNITDSCHDDTSTDLYIVSGYCISETGPLTDESKTPQYESYINNRILKKPHVVNYTAKYDLVSRLARGSRPSDGQPGTTSSEGDNVGCHGGSVEATVSWTKHCCLLDEPPLDATSTLLITPVSGDQRCATYPMYCDLLTLQGFLSGLTDGLVKWSVLDSDIPLIDRVKYLVDEQQLGDTTRIARRSERGCSTGDDTGMTLKQLQLPERQDLDFTEHLWNVLRDCASYADLVDCLQHVISCLCNGTLQPMVHRENKTKLAQLIRESYNNQLDATILSRLSPLELLVEVGFDKLLRDYTHAFLAKDFVTMSHISPVVSREPNAPPATRLAQLFKLHQILEMVVLLEQYLNLPHPLLCTVARQSLKFYETNNVSSQDAFSVPVQTAAVSSLLKNVRAKQWKASFVTSASVQSAELHASVCMTSTPSFPHTSLPAVGDTSLMEHKHFVGYYITAANEFSAVV